MPPRNKEELQGFLRFANYHGDFIPFHTAKVRPMQELLRKNQHLYWNENIKKNLTVEKALADATGLAAPNEEEHFTSVTDAGAVPIAGIIHKEQEYNGKSIRRPIVNGSKSLTRTQLNYGASKLEMYAVLYLVEKFHSYLVGRELTLQNGQPGSFVAEDILHGSGNNWTLGCASRSVPLQGYLKPPHARQKCRRS